VHRFEPSGALHGLMRVRAFTQDDAHVFITEEQIAAEALAMNDLILSIYRDFGFSDVAIKFSDRPDKRIGDDAVWDKAEAALMATLKASGRPWTLNKGEGAFYGPKLEYVLRDAIGRDWQCGTIQVDLNMPGRLGAFYIDEHSNKVTPVMLHRAMFGSLERFTGILIEHYAGHFPLWLAPTQLVIATIVSDADGYAHEAADLARRAGLRVETDLRNEKINYKVREHSLAKVPALLVVGKKEAETRTVSIRRLGAQDQTVVGLNDALNELGAEAIPPDIRRWQATDLKAMANMRLGNLHFAVIGRIAALWAHFESVIDSRLFAFANLKPETGVCFTGQMIGIRPRVDAFIALVRQLGADKRWNPALEKFASDARGLAEQRNRAVHDVWQMDDPAQPQRLEATARRKVRLEKIHVPTEELIALADSIDNLITRFVDEIAGGIFDELRASPDTKQ
jgi:hypothetical protein